MAAYYNEFDPFAAAWLRELIKAGLIPDGEVDERSIVDVRGDDLRGFAQCHFFAGIGGWAHALQLAGWPEDREVWTGSCPCQPLSVAGQGRGHADERHLWPAFYALIAERSPAVVFGEQVASKLGREWLAGVRTDLEHAGYACGAANLPACSVGAPHRRERLWWVAVEHAYERRHGAADQALRAGRACIEPASGDGGVADAERNGQFAFSQSCGAQDEGRLFQSEGSCDDGGVADAERDRRISADARAMGGKKCSFEGSQSELGSFAEGVNDRCYGGGGVADAAPELLDGSGNAGPRRWREFADSSGVGDTERAGLAEQRSFAGISREQGRPSSWQTAERADASTGFWSDAVWLAGADGKARRVKPGVRLLVAGLPGRVGLLRGLGNSIVPQVGAAFVKAFIDARA